MKKITYFISYAYSDKNGEYGFGNCSIEANPILNIEGIDELVDIIKENKKHDSVTVLFYREF